MAKIVFGMATSRSPMLTTPPNEWTRLGENDMRNQRLRDIEGNIHPYAEVLAKAGPAIAKEMAPDVFQKKHSAAVGAMNGLVDKLAAADPDVVVVMGDDSNEAIREENRPPILIYRGEGFRNVRPPRFAAAPTPYWEDHEIDRPVNAKLSEQLTEFLIDAEFDVSDSLKISGMSHGFAFIYEHLMPKKVFPIVPIILNVATPPSIPTPTRCYRLGQAVRRAIEAWPADLKVAFIATGGLSVGVLEEALDRKALAAMQAKDVATMATLPRRWMEAGTGEVLAWIGAAGIGESMKMEYEYIPGYRTPGGTGCGLAFAQWT